MKITFCGAAQEVTGTCILIETNSEKFLIDCGLFQGTEFATDDNAKPFIFNPSEINFVLLSHAHADHCARLSKLVNEGFAGKIYATEPTIDLAQIIMEDAAGVMAIEAGNKHQEPIYQVEDIEKVMPLFSSVKYQEKIQITENISARFVDAGHILGSAQIEVLVKEDGVEKKIAFTGDLGNAPVPLVCDPDSITGADIAITESTYGGRVHEPAELRTQLLSEVILDSVAKGGTLIIPAFSLERTQELLYELKHLLEEKKIPNVPMFVDSPLSIKAIAIYKKYIPYFDDQAQKIAQSGQDLFMFPGLKYTNSVDESKGINSVEPPKIIIAGAGMCNGGRVLYHLKLNLPNKNSKVLIISYQAKNTLGRELLDGAKKIKIQKETVAVRATIKAIGAYSSHADHPRLVSWVSKLVDPKPDHVFIVHGEEKNNLMLKGGIRQKTGIEATIAQRDQVYEV